MIGEFSVVRLSAAALALVAPATAALAVTTVPPAIGTATVIHPVTVTKLKDMDFGFLASAATGTAVLEPNADALSTTGGTTTVGGSPHCAEFVGSALSSMVVNIKVQHQPSP